MGKITIRLSSVTYAMKVKKMFLRNGISANVVKTGISSKDNGCAYGLNINRSNLFDAIRLLKESGIAYSLID